MKKSFQCPDGQAHLFTSILFDQQEPNKITGHRCCNCQAVITPEELVEFKEVMRYTLDDEFEREYQGYRDSCYDPAGGPLPTNQDTELRLAFLAGMLVGTRILVDGFPSLPEDIRASAGLFMARLQRSAAAANRLRD